MRRKGLSKEGIIRKKLLLQQKCHDKKLKWEGKYYEKESILRKSKLLEKNHYEYYGRIIIFERRYHYEKVCWTLF